jgi:hypothetical protein
MQSQIPAHVPPAGWVYVAWHERSPGFSKIGYSKWHPIEPDERYSFKRIDQISRYLVSFGFGPLDRWASPFHPEARTIENAVHRELKAYRRRDVGPSTDIFAIDPREAISLIESKF